MACYIRRGQPETTITVASKPFDRLCVELYERKLVDYGLRRHLIELIGGVYLWSKGPSELG